MQGPIERAPVSINNGAFVATLIPGLVDNTATRSLGGATVVNCGTTTESGTGCFDVMMPFGTTLVSNITLHRALLRRGSDAQLRFLADVAAGLASA